jgi:hypothetical protein
MSRSTSDATGFKIWRERGLATGKAKFPALQNKIPDISPEQGNRIPCSQSAHRSSDAWRMALDAYPADPVAHPRHVIGQRGWRIRLQVRRRRCAQSTRHPARGVVGRDTALSGGQSRLASLDCSSRCCELCQREGLVKVPTRAVSVYAVDFRIGLE